jgi:hypothetical protein
LEKGNAGGGVLRVEQSTNDIDGMRFLEHYN